MNAKIIKWLKLPFDIPVFAHSVFKHPRPHPPTRRPTHTHTTLNSSGQTGKSKDEQYANCMQKMSSSWKAVCVTGISNQLIWKENRSSLKETEEIIYIQKKKQPKENSPSLPRPLLWFIEILHCALFITLSAHRDEVSRIQSYGSDWQLVWGRRWRPALDGRCHTVRRASRSIPSGWNCRRWRILSSLNPIKIPCSHSTCLFPAGSEARGHRCAVRTQWRGSNQPSRASLCLIISDKNTWPGSICDVQAIPDLQSGIKNRLCSSAGRIPGLEILPLTWYYYIYIL